MRARGDYNYNVEIIRVIDADSIVCRIDLGFHTFTVQTLRLHGINAPEMRGEEKPLGVAATNHLRTLISDCVLLRISTIRDRKGKYGRYLAVLYDDAGNNINDRLVADGHAVAREY